jgi:uncharacterized protein (TIGR00369 family)
MSLSNEELRDQMNKYGPPTAELLGMRILDVDQDIGFIRLEAIAKPEFCNPMGSVQGGFVAAILDDAAALSVVVKSKERIVVPTLEFKVSFFAAAKPGKLYAEGRCLKLGKRAAFMESKLYDPDGILLASMTTTAIPFPLPEKANFVERSQ